MDASVDDMLGGLPIGAVEGTVAGVAGIGLVAGATSVINNQLNNAVEGAKKDVEREKG